MRRIIWATGIVAAFTLAGCTGSNYGYNRPLHDSAAARTVGGAAAGAVIADATGGSKTRGALIGAVIGGGSCAVPGTNNCY
ncbi:hypothetical protein [Ruixingdingia sedimenti]|uniref:17 kDa surface antigen n=1 Tax=Ruixingdingia sedimenti TaxID=3073604 RepID=A0ABU1F767_9RHOB|nr:hypothetical protein [Xinfangfangia sp. LG-4]MDR5652284.1 hypothetical protein [Xinfangfangia sp. LG-4]